MTTVSQEAREAADEAIAIEAARKALFHAELARTGVTNPVNGTASYSWVRFHGQVKTFCDDEWTIEQHRTAGTEKAAAYAQAINDGLFNLAKEAAANALARHRHQAERDTLARMDPVATIRFDRGTPGNENEMPKVISCVWMPDGEYTLYALPPAPEAV